MTENGRITGEGHIMGKERPGTEGQRAAANRPAAERRMGCGF